MTASMLLTRVAKDGLMVPFICTKNTPATTSKPGKDTDEEESAVGEGKKNCNDHITYQRPQPFTNTLPVIATHSKAE